MHGPAYKWLLAPVQSAAVERAQLARRSFPTLAVASFCLVCALVMPPPALSPAAKAGNRVASPVAATLDQTDVELPRMLIRFWFLLPQLLPARN